MRSVFPFELSEGLVTIAQRQRGRVRGRDGVSSHKDARMTIDLGLNVRALGSLRVVLDGHLAKATRNRLEGARGSFPLGENHKVWCLRRPAPDSRIS